MYGASYLDTCAASLRSLAYRTPYHRLLYLSRMRTYRPVTTLRAPPHCFLTTCSSVEQYSDILFPSRAPCRQVTGSAGLDVDASRINIRAGGAAPQIVTEGDLWSYVFDWPQPCQQNTSPKIITAQCTGGKCLASPRPTRNTQTTLSNIQISYFGAQNLNQYFSFSRNFIIPRSKGLA